MFACFYSSKGFAFSSSSFISFLSSLTPPMDLQCGTVTSTLHGHLMLICMIQHKDFQIHQQIEIYQNSIIRINLGDAAPSDEFHQNITKTHQVVPFCTHGSTLFDDPYSN